MKKLFLILFLSYFFFGNIENSFAWDTIAAKYMPLQIGNVWAYSYSYSFPGGGAYGFERITITNTENINGKVYYILQLERRIVSGFYTCDPRIYMTPLKIRIDSTSMNLFRFGICGSNSESLIDSLKAKLNDSSKVCGNFQGNRAKCSDTANALIFNQIRETKTFSVSGFEGYNRQTYVKGIGMKNYLYGQLMSQCNYNLTGCLINGVVYGDTSLQVGIIQISTEIPENFSLSQNYPNPFNPITHFGFRIADFGLVNLTIYDALGREVTVLVNQQLQPGTYEVDWDASAYPSGVYYCKLESGNFTETRKMLMIK